MRINPLLSYLVGLPNLPVVAFDIAVQPACSPLAGGETIGGIGHLILDAEATTCEAYATAPALSRYHLHGVNVTDDDSTASVSVMDGVFLDSVLTALVAVA